MRILLVNSHSGLGGAETHVRQLVRGLTHRGHDVHVASPEPGPLVDFVRGAGAHHHPAPMYPHRPSPRQVWRIARIIQMVSPDLVHLHGVRAGLIGRLSRCLLTGRARATPFVYTVHGAHFLHYRSPLDRVYARVEHVLSPLAEATVFVCRDDLARSLAVGATEDRRATIVLNALDADWNNRFEGLATRGRSAARADVGLPPDRAIVLAVGRLHHQKDYPMLLNALSLLARPGGPARPSASDGGGYGANGTDPALPLTVIAGSGPLDDELASLARRLQLDEDDVRFLGARDDVPLLMAAADVLVLSSLWEGLPYVVLEAMAAGLPVIATDVGGNGEAVVDRVTGSLVPPAAPQALADAIAALCAAPRLRERMGASARHRVSRLFTEDRMLDETLEVYQRAISARAHARRGHWGRVSERGHARATSTPKGQASATTPR